MKQNYIIGALLGVLVGGAAGVVLRPSIPMVGQPPIDVAFATLTGSGGPDFGYGAQFGQTLFLFILIAAAIGAGAAFLVEKSKAN